MSAKSPACTTSGELHTMVVPLDGTEWSLAVDPENEGRELRWYEGPGKDAKPTKVPWVIQDAFPDYHGVAWYWREFTAPANPHVDGRYLLRFRSVDYLAEVWLNDVRLGIHEDSQEPFVLDATSAVRPGTGNRLAIRVLSPTYEPIDGIGLREVAEGRRDYPYPKDNAFSTGGIVGSVELLVAPAVRVEDLYVVPDWETGVIRVETSVCNSGPEPARVRVQLTVAPAGDGETVVEAVCEHDLPQGDVLVDGVLDVDQHRLWELNDPYLYRVTARVRMVGGNSSDERSVRCGFRDFRFEDGYFRLNGRRIRLHGPLYVIPQYPVTQTVPHDEEVLRRDVLNMKAVGFNIVRISCGPALPRQLDMLDELGLLACEEHFGARALLESPLLEERWDGSVSAVIRRDRNHPSIVMWSLLNEVPDGRLFRHAASALPLVRSMDGSRMVLLNSGRFDRTMLEDSEGESSIFGLQVKRRSEPSGDRGSDRDPAIGSFSNPGSHIWESGFRDVHAYPAFPHTSDIIQSMRTGEGEGPMLLSEYGVCGAEDYARFVRHFEQLGKEHVADARLYREKLERFLSDWEKWDLDACWARPEDYFAESQRNQARLALEDYSAWMANPDLVGSFTSTQICDAWFHGCGITNYFRELKPGMADAYTDLSSRVRWCLFVAPVNVYQGSKVRLEAVLVNLDALKPGEYPVRVQVVGPGMVRLLETTFTVEVPDTTCRPEPSFAQPVYAEDLIVNGPPGSYRFLVTFERGAAAGGGAVEFHVGEAAAMPAGPIEVVLWGQDAELAAWLSGQGIRTRSHGIHLPTAREVILASGRPPAPGGAQVFAPLARRIAAGSSVVFLTPETLMETGLEDGTSVGFHDVNTGGGSGPVLRWAPVPSAVRPSLDYTPVWYFRADHWAKCHPIFEGLPCGGIMDYTFYNDILPAAVAGSNYAPVLTGLQPPLEAVSGAIQTSGGGIDYRSDLLVSVHDLGAGRVILNALQIRQNLGKVPAAEHLLRNMLRYAAQDVDRPLAEVPGGFDEQLRTMGFV